MIIYDNTKDKKTYIPLSTLGIYTNDSFYFEKHSRTKGNGIYLDFINDDEIKEILNDAILLYATGLNLTYDQYDIIFCFVYYFDTETAKINVDICSLDEKIESEIYFNVELDNNDRKYLCKSLAKMLYNV